MNNSLAERNHYFFDAIPSHKLKCYGMESEKAQLFVGCAHRDRNMINHLKFAETNCSLAIQLSLHWTTSQLNGTAGQMPEATTPDTQLQFIGY